MDKRQEGESIGDWLKRTAIKDSGWLVKAKWRQDNEYWLCHSKWIAVLILSKIRKENISKDQLKEILGFELGRILNGDDDLTLSQISKIQDFLDVKIINHEIRSRDKE